MIQFSYLILGLGNHGNYSVETERTNSTFDTQSREKLLTVKRVLARTESDIWRCDPDRQVEGTTYVALKKLLQVSDGIAPILNLKLIIIMIIYS